MIEVTTQDTVTVYPNEFEYRFKFNMHPDYDPYGKELSLDDYQAQTRQREKLLKKLLPKYAFEYTESCDSLGNTVSVTFHEDDIDRFAQLLGNFEGTELDYRRYETRYDSLEKLEESLNKQLLQQARKKAQALAKLTGLSLNRIDGITDKPMQEKIDDFDEGGWVVFPPHAHQEIFLEIIKYRSPITYEKQITVRFSTE